MDLKAKILDDIKNAMKNKEAERLASLHPDVTVAVLEVTDLVRLNTLERHSFDVPQAAAVKPPSDAMDEIPF